MVLRQAPVGIRKAGRSGDINFEPFAEHRVHRVSSPLSLSTMGDMAASAAAKCPLAFIFLIHPGSVQVETNAGAYLSGREDRRRPPEDNGS
jgi:hypothetical protein